VSETFWQWYEQATTEAERRQIPQHELEWLIHSVLGIEKLQLRLKPPLNVRSVSQIKELWQERMKHRVPVQYLAGKVQWRGLELEVNSAVLIPRPETELIIEVVHSLVSPSSPLRSGIWLDMGTGSGAIAIGLEQILPSAQIYAVDVSASALSVAKRNAQKHHSQISFYQSNWFSAIPHLRGKVSGIVSNPPYIPTAEIERLAEEVKCHEPILALDGGWSGLEAIETLLAEMPKFLIADGVFVIEVMAGQAARVIERIEQAGAFQQLQVHRDYGGHERFVSGRRA
jgi:release factor glutamine methyltransferase